MNKDEVKNDLLNQFIGGVVRLAVEMVKNNNPVNGTKLETALKEAGKTCKSRDEFYNKALELVSQRGTVGFTFELMENQN